MRGSGGSVGDRERARGDGGGALDTRARAARARSRFPSRVAVSREAREATGGRRRVSCFLCRVCHVLGVVAAGLPLLLRERGLIRVECELRHGAIVQAYWGMITLYCVFEGSMEERHSVKLANRHANRRLARKASDDDGLLVRASAVLKSQGPGNWPRVGGPVSFGRAKPQRGVRTC